MSSLYKEPLFNLEACMEYELRKARKKILYERPGLEWVQERGGVGI